MKKNLLALSCMFFAFKLFAQSNQTWYKVFNGKSGTLNTTLHLHKAGKNYSGYVWLDQTQTAMQVYSYYIPKTDSIQLSGSSGPISLVLTGILTANSFTGNSQYIKEGSTTKEAGFELQENKEKTFSSFNYFFSEAKDSIPPQYKNQSRFDYFSSSVWPTGTTPVDESLKKFIRFSLGMKAPIAETGKFITDGKNKLLKEWKEAYIKIGPKETADLGQSLSHWQENKILVMHENEKLISLANYSFLEAGGQMHGEFSTTVATFNKQTGKQLFLKDVVNPQGINLLPAILDKVARIIYGIKNNKPLDENGFTVKKIMPTENIYVTGVGICFVYAPYQIKSFADGEINLVIPFTALTNYLMPGIK